LDAPLDYHGQPQTMPLLLHMSLVVNGFANCAVVLDIRINNFDLRTLRCSQCDHRLVFSAGKVGVGGPTQRRSMLQVIYGRMFDGLQCPYLEEM
jgi:hypothetical protein